MARTGSVGAAVVGATVGEPLATVGESVGAADGAPDVGRKDG